MVITGDVYFLHSLFMLFLGAVFYHGLWVIWYSLWGKRNRFWGQKKIEVIHRDKNLTP